jgi:cyclophilin family peptidyl-prolyl cis-trans isomerase
VPSEKRQRQREGRQFRQEELQRAQQTRKNRRRLIVGGVIAVVVVGVLLIANLGGKKSSSSNSSSSSTTSSTASTSTTAAASGVPQAAPVPAGETITGNTPCPKADGSSKRTSQFAKPPPTCIDPNKTYTATFDTTEGTVVVNLDTKRTPNTANNFVVLSRYHYYDGSAIFRTDPSIDIIQGGAPTTQSASDPGPGYTIKDEGGKFTYAAGDLVMARTDQPNSAGAQFFFVTGDKASGLNSQGTYVTFGKVTQGLDVIQKIIGLNKDDPTSGLGGGPSRVVTVKSVTIKES